MGSTTKVDQGFLKTNRPNQKSAGIGFQHTEFYHEAVAGDLEIDFNSLTLPSEAASEGFSNPSPSTLIGAELKYNRGNLFLYSTSHGYWIDRKDYTIKANGKITLKVAAVGGEIFHGVIHNVTRNVLENPDLQNIVAVGTLAQGQTTFNVGKLFKVYQNPLTKIGEIMVFRGTAPLSLMVRNSGNATASVSADGNYEEVNSNNGYGSTIEFNTAGGVGGETVVVVSTGRLLERPSDSLLQELEKLAGQIDSLTPYVEELAGLAPGTISVSPNNADLKAFGDYVIALKQSLATLYDVSTPVSSYTKTKWQKKTGSGSAITSGTLVTMNSIVAGKTYRITSRVYITMTSTAAYAISGNYQINGVTFDSWAEMGQCNVGNPKMYKDVIVFTAPASGVLTLTVSSASGVNADPTNSYMILEELPNHELTTQWT